MSNEQNTINSTLIFDEKRSLRVELTSVKVSRIVIVSAFASKTVDVVRTILRNENSLTLIVGTINYFTDPDFIHECVELATHYKHRFKFLVDFRGNDSIHWKLYLIGPNRVVIGSANLTRKGLSMQRDTAVMVKDNTLFTAYNQRINELCQKDGVISSRHQSFEKLLHDYIKAHRRATVQNLNAVNNAMSSSSQPPTFTTWIEQDHAQVLPILIWDRDVTKAEEKHFEEKVKPLASQIDAIELIGIHEGSKTDQVYFNGDIILTVKYSGAYANFYKVDIVLYADGLWWLCGFVSTSFQIPFALTPDIKRAIKAQVSQWSHVQKRYLTTNDLRRLAIDAKE